jgi:ankyrin repeat protein
MSFGDICWGGTPEAVQAAIDAGADVNAAVACATNPNEPDKLPLVQALFSNGEHAVAILKVLLDNKADPNKKYSSPVAEVVTLTPTIVPFMLPKDAVPNLESYIKILLENGGDANAKITHTVMEGKVIPYGRSILEFACWDNLSTPVIQLLLDKGADPDHATEDGGLRMKGAFPLFLAAEKANADNVKVLIQAGCKKLVHPYAGTPVMVAAFKGSLDVVNQLLAMGYDVNSTDGANQDALMMAAASGSVECCKALIEAGADPNRNSKAGKCCTKMAKINGHMECYAYLRPLRERTNKCVIA